MNEMNEELQPLINVDTGYKGRHFPVYSSEKPMLAVQGKQYNVSITQFSGGFKRKQLLSIVYSSTKRNDRRTKRCLPLCNHNWKRILDRSAPLLLSYFQFGTFQLEKPIIRQPDEISLDWIGLDLLVPYFHHSKIIWARLDNSGTRKYMSDPKWRDWSFEEKKHIWLPIHK